jgi:hypothetical protein
VSNEKQYNKRIDRPTGGTIRFFNNEENEWTEKRFGRSVLANGSGGLARRRNTMGEDGKLAHLRPLFVSLTGKAGNN